MLRWDLPSFDAVSSTDVPGSRVDMPAAPVLPTVDEIQSIRAKAHQEGFSRGLQEGLAEGRAQGHELGKQEGFEQGRSEGFQSGYQQGYQGGALDLEQQLKSLREVLGTLSDLPDEIESALTSWVYETAVRLAGRVELDRSIFAAAVQEALMRLPRPGEHLFVRVSPQDMAMWSRLVDDSLSFKAVLQPDPELLAGHAYVEVGGTHLDVGEQARRALVKSALGLLETMPDDGK